MKSELTEEVMLVSRSCVSTFLRVKICSVSGCIGRIGEEFIMSSAVLIYMYLVLIVFRFL